MKNTHFGAGFLGASCRSAGGLAQKFAQFGFDRALELERIDTRIDAFERCKSSGIKS